MLAYSQDHDQLDKKTSLKFWGGMGNLKTARQTMPSLLLAAQPGKLHP